MECYQLLRYCGFCCCFGNKNQRGKYTPLLSIQKTEKEQKAEAAKLDIPFEIFKLIEQFYLFNSTAYIDGNSSKLGPDCNVLNGLANRYYKILVQDSFFDASVDAIEIEKAEESQKHIDAYSKHYKLKLPHNITLSRFQELFLKDNQDRGRVEELIIPGEKANGQISAGMPAALKFLNENLQEIVNRTAQAPAIEAPMSHNAGK